MQTIAFDTETCGLHGLPVTLQWCNVDTPHDVTYYEFWHHTIRESMDLISWLCEQRIIMFNATFDWFHIVKMYNCLRTAVLCGADENLPPEICEIAAVEKLAIHGVVVKPKHVLDIFLHARKGPYQSTMDRSNISIRRVPNKLAAPLAEELEKRVPLNQIYFARKGDPNAPQWGVYDSKDHETRELIPDFSDVILRFAPSNALKALAVDALGVSTNDIMYFTDVEVDKRLRPKEFGYAPFHEAVRGWGSWPDMIQFHIDHWHYSKDAKKYANLDATYTAQLYEYFEKPDFDDHDSILACSVANVRWKGYRIDVQKLKDMREAAAIQSKLAPTDWHYVLPWLRKCMSETENAVVHDTTKSTLESIAKWIDTCPNCTDGCNSCDEGDIPHAAAVRAKAVIAARRASKEVELYDKLIHAERFHPSYKIIGALSGRMSGADGLNPQGIKRSKSVRTCFYLADEDEILAGGDFDSFEVVLAAAEYKDEDLTRDLKSGKKIHAVAAMDMYEDASYEDIIASKGSQELDMYTKGKNMVFSLIYGGDEGTLQRKSGLTEEHAQQTFDNFLNRYKKIKEARDAVFRMFCPMRQPTPGGPVIWAKPARFVESMFGFRRYFDLENSLCEALFRLAENPPEEWKRWKFKVKRRADRIQTAMGATRSALYGAAFGVQGSNMRAAGNHKIQSAGAQVTKHLQVVTWGIQPYGIHPWVVRPMNVHDEVNTVCANPEVAKHVTVVTHELVESYRDRVPLIAIDWNEYQPSWGSTRCKKCGVMYDEPTHCNVP